MRYHTKVSTAGDVSTPPEVLAVLADDEDERVRREVAANPSNLIDVLDRLSSDSDWKTRWEVAGNSTTPGHVLAVLAGDEGWQVRAKVAFHPALPIDALEGLAYDKDARVRTAAARHPHQPFETAVAAYDSLENEEPVLRQQLIARIDDPDVRRIVERVHHLPLAVAIDAAHRVSGSHAASPDKP